jgi:cell division septation protein DedD
MRAGHDSVRTRADGGPTRYAVLIERVASAAEARTIGAVLREQGLETVVSTSEPVVIRVGEPRVLRGAVELAARVRKAGYQVRVVAQPGGGAAYTIRHGSFATRDEAEGRSRELARLSVPVAQVVQVR